MVADGEVVMKKMVSALAQSSAQQLKKTESVDNFKRIVPSLIDKGLDNINLNMFSEDMRLGLETLDGILDTGLRASFLPEGEREVQLEALRAPRQALRRELGLPGPA